MLQVTPKTPIDLDRVRADFPILAREVNGHRLVYLDSAASSQKPSQVERGGRRHLEHAQILP